ncbi:hypothetical protein [Thermomonospora umbrina]|uniref:hypothetical protein n=1 Tax=Thermomonospora umbrina TaxID=111806 RepID=UPI000E261BA2|nr:hypothetical protein [Thermomonospora umbrina]
MLAATATPGHAAPSKHTYATTAQTRITGLGADFTLGPGRADVDADLATRQISADFTVPPARSAFPMFGFLPTHATFEITQAAPLQGTLENGAAAVSGKVDIQITEVGHLALKIPLKNCRTTEPATISLTSQGTFDPATGGTLTGTYRIPKVAGCGIDTPIINALVAGKDDPLSIKLDAKG